MKKIIFCWLMLAVSALSAQERDKALPEGNEKYADKDYASAEADYRVSQSKFNKKATSSYNLGNAIYRQNHVSEAKAAYLKAIQNAKTRPHKHYAYHNLGNVYMKEKKYAEAVEAYKNALRNNPADEQTRYNFALAKKLLKENPPPKDKNDDKKDDKKGDKKDKKDQNQDKKDDKKDGDDKKDEKKDGDGKDKPEPKGNKPQDQKPGQSPGGIPKQRLESMLDAVNNEEKKIQQKVNAKKVKVPPVQTEKDW